MRKKEGKKLKWEEEFRGIKSNVVKEFHCDFFSVCAFAFTAITIYITTFFSFYFEYLTILGPFSSWEIQTVTIKIESKEEESRCRNGMDFWLRLDAFLLLKYQFVMELSIF